MLRWLRQLTRNRVAPQSASRDTANLPVMDRQELESFIRMEEGLPHLDWSGVCMMMERRCAENREEFDGLTRAAMSAWVDELRDAFNADMRRWRHPSIEGVGPGTRDVARRLASSADRAAKIISRSLEPIRGSANENPIPAIAIIAAPTSVEYYSFIAPYYGEGEHGTSGGIYLRESDENCPALVVDAQTNWSVENTVAHELTHHALAGRGIDSASGPSLPLWAEEGLTQMMEERVTGHTSFQFDHKIKSRHQELWSRIGLDGFLRGESFGSPTDDQQELSYNLAEAITRSLLATRPRDFFAFARACVLAHEDPSEAASTHFGCDAEDLLTRFLGI